MIKKYLHITIYFKATLTINFTKKIYTEGANNLLSLSSFYSGKCHDNTVTFIYARDTWLSWHLPLFFGNQHDQKITYIIWFILKAKIYYFPKSIQQVAIIHSWIPHHGAVFVMNLASLALPIGKQHEYSNICRVFFADTNMIEKLLKHTDYCDLFYFTKIILQVSIICWDLLHFSAVRIMKIPTLAFPKGIHYEYPDICRVFSETNMIEIYPTDYDLRAKIIVR